MPDLAAPIVAAAFLQDRLDVGDLVLEAGLRLDYFDANVEMPRTAGFVFNVPDSLKSGFVRWDASTQDFVPLFDEFTSPRRSPKETPGETKSRLWPKITSR